MSEIAKPVPAVRDDLRPFFEAAAEGRLVVQRCIGCGALRFPARPLCSSCLGREADWVPVSGRGTVFTFNVMHQVYHPGFRDDVPYAVVLVELEEGPRMISRLVGCPPDQVEIGMPVAVLFERVSDDVTLPKFRPA